MTRIIYYYSIVKKGQFVKAKRTNIIKKQGTKTLTGILAVCMTLGTPISVLADDNTSDSTMEQQVGVQMYWLKSRWFRNFGKSI